MFSVLASYEKANENQTKYIILKKPTIEKRQNESPIDEFSTVNDISVSNNESNENSTIATSTETFIALDSSTEAIANQTENNSIVTDSPTEVTTVLETETESIVLSTEITLEELPATESELVTVEPEPTSQETEPISLEPETTSLEPETISPEPETIPSQPDTISPEPEVTSLEPETTIDPKYRNETLELYIENFMRNNPSAIKYTSPEFPVPYRENLNITWRYVSYFLTSN